MSAIVASTAFAGPSGMSVPKSTCRGPKNSRTQRVGRAEQRRVDVEPAEVVERRPRKSVLDLPVAGTHRESGGEVRHQAAPVVRDHELARVTLHVPGIDQA